MHDHKNNSTAATLPARIVLTGFMGAGKTTVGRILAERLGWSFVDLDDAIVEAEGQDIATLFATIGEESFREREHAALQRVLPQTSMVLALGGGAIETAKNRELLHALPDTRIIFLEAPLATLLARCQQQQAQPGAAERPVLADLENLLQRYMARLPHYRSAHHAILTTGQEPARVADAVLRQLQSS